MPLTYFDLFGLPPEVRSTMYSFYFATSSTTDFGILLNNSPDNALLATSKIIYRESIDTFKAAEKKHTHDQYQLLISITDILSTRTGTRSPILYPVPGGYTLGGTAGPNKATATIVANTLLRGGRPYCTGPQCKSHNGCIGPCGCDFSKPLSPACSTCLNFMRLALYLMAFPEKKYHLLKSNWSGGLNDAGKDIKQYIDSHTLNIYAEFTCARAFAVDFLRLELDKQEFVDLRCNIRSKVVEDYYYKLEHLGTPFSERYIYLFEVETMWPELKAFNDFEKNYRGGELKWRYEYEQRALKNRTSGAKQAPGYLNWCRPTTSDRRSASEETKG